MVPLSVFYVFMYRVGFVHVVFFTWRRRSQVLPDLKQEQFRELQAPLRWRMSIPHQLVTAWMLEDYQFLECKGLASWTNAATFVKVILVVSFPICRSIVAGNRSRSVRICRRISYGDSCISGCGLSITLQNSFAGVVNLRCLASIWNEAKSPILNVSTEGEELCFRAIIYPAFFAFFRTPMNIVRVSLVLCIMAWILWSGRLT